MLSILHIEARLLPTGKSDPLASSLIGQWLRDNYHSLCPGDIISSLAGSVSDSTWLPNNVECITVMELSTGISSSSIPLNEVELDVHVYQLFPPISCTLSSGLKDGSGEDVVMSRVVTLPSDTLNGLWESLVFEPDVKSLLFQFMSSIMFFTEKQVNPTCVAFNRLVLLHGPPGSGKTSLCRALAQKLAIRLSKKYSICKLLEVNSHSLFSKYFSESGKLVGLLFDRILELLADADTFGVVIIDEIETLTASRKAAANGNEPTDGLRVVNALLTGLDKLQTQKNVIILTTSNLVESIDPAFLDRADVRMFIDKPGAQAIYAILRSCMNELVRAKIIIDAKEIPPSDEARLSLFSRPDAPSSRLWKCSEMCLNFSGRTLRKLPVKMHAAFIQRPECTMLEALDALEKAVEEENGSISLKEY